MVLGPYQDLRKMCNIVNQECCYVSINDKHKIEDNMHLQIIERVIMERTISFSILTKDHRIRVSDGQICKMVHKETYKPR